MKSKQTERSAFEEIRRYTEPDPFFRQRLVDNLRSGGFIKSEKQKMKRFTIYWAAATVAALIMGFTIGQSTLTGPSIDNRTQYALFLYENGDFNVEDVNSLISEYGRWAQDLAEKGHLVNAEKLSDKGEWMGQVSTRNENSFVSGYFIFRADSYEDALRIALTHPHTSYGGGLELRPIEKLN